MVIDISQHLRIMPLGDSITRGEGSLTKGGYRGPLTSQLIDVQHWWTANYVGSLQDGSIPNSHHEGHSGWRIDQLTAQVTSWLTAQGPDVVLLQAGTNDALQGADHATMLARMRDLLGRILAWGPDVRIILGDLIPARYGTDRDVASVAMQRYNRDVPALVDEMGSRVVLARHHLAAPNRLLGDGLHPNDVGYERMAWVWLRALGVLISPDGIVRAGENPLPWDIPTEQLIHVGGT